MTTPTLLHHLFKYKAWANEELFSQVEKLDAEDFPTQRHRAVRLLNHVYVVDRMFAAHLSGAIHGYTATNTVETPSLAELRAAVAELDAWYIEYVRNLPVDRLVEPVDFVFSDGGNGRMSREEMLAHVATHGGYHRGAVGELLVVGSIAAPRDIFTRYLHEAEPERRTRS